MLELRNAAGSWNHKILIPGLLWINSRECASCGTRLRPGKHGFHEYPGPLEPLRHDAGDKFAAPLIIRGVVKIFGADFGVRHCRVWRYDLFIRERGVLGDTSLRLVDSVSTYHGGRACPGG